MSARRARVRNYAALALAGAGVVLAACASTVTGTGHGPPLIQKYVTGVRVLGQQATSSVVATSLGAGVASAPSVAIAQSATVINGGSVQEDITASGPFKRLRIGLRPAAPGASTGPGAPSLPATASAPTTAGTPTTAGVPSTSLAPSAFPGSSVPSGNSSPTAGTSNPPGAPPTVGAVPPTSISLPAYPTVSSAPASPTPVTSVPVSSGAPQGVTLPSTGYQEITLRKPTKSANVVITLTQDLPGGFTFFFAVVDDNGTQGLLARQHVQALPVGAGQVQVSVSWDRDSDVDLHVIDPNGEEIYWDHRGSASGGVLDLDSNADCELDHKRNENVTWKKAPPGRYTVRVDYYRSCGEPSSDYVVTVQVVGQPTQVFNGTFTGDGDQGGSGSGTTVTTFTVR